MGRSLALVGAIVVVLGRVLVEPRLDLPTVEGSCEAFAHLFVGGLFGACLASRGTRHDAIYGDSTFYFLLGTMLSLFELAIFLVQKFGGVQ